MATSSLYKTFYITEKDESRNFVALLADAIKNPPSPRKIIQTKKLPKSEWEKLTNATIQQKQ